MKDEDLELSIDERPKHKVVHFSGKLQITNVEAFRKDLFQLVDADDKEVIFDMKELEFVDSSGIGLLIQVHRKMAASNRKLSFQNLSSTITQVFHVSGLDKIFQID